MRRQAQLNGALVHLGPFLAIVTIAWLGEDQVWAATSRTAELIGIGLTASLGGALFWRRPVAAASLVTAAVAGFIWVNRQVLLSSPGLALASALAAVLTVMVVWGVRRHRGSTMSSAAIVHRVRASAFTSVLIWFVVIVARLGNGGPPWLVALGLSPTLWFSVSWLLRERGKWPRRIMILLALPAVLLAIQLASAEEWEALVSVPAVWSGAVLAVTGRKLEAEQSSGWLDMIAAHPSRLLVVTFAVLILIGSLLLALPASSTADRSVGVFDSAFTAVSAVCVTGLIVLDTPNDFSGFGQVLILTLIQLGGLGIMTFSAAALGLLGRRLSLRHEGSLAGLLSGDDRSALTRSLKALFLVTFVAEALGAAVLTGAFALEGDGFATALWRGVFTAVSAFCNAGFALQTDSLVSYRQNGLILHVVAFLIVVGGVSPITTLALPNLLRRRPTALQTKVAVAVTAMLLLSGTVMIAAIEWTSTLSDLSWVQRLNNAWFQSVTLRTAGFNSIDVSQVQPATLTLMLVWMFIGGSPGGTAGGIKTTTVAVLILAIVGAIRGRAQIIVFGRYIPQDTLYRASTIATVGALVVGVAVLAMQLTQDMPDRMALFEVISALGTVGLSIGGTSHLDRVGELIIMCCMFLGRVGPLTMLVFLMEHRAGKVWRLPAGRIEVG